VAGVVRRTYRARWWLSALPFAAAFDGFGAAAFALAFDVAGAGFVVVNVAGFDIDAFLAFVEMQVRPADADEKSFDLTFVFLFRNDVEREIGQLAGLGFLARIESFEHVAPADVAGEAHRIVCNVNTVDPGSALLDQFLHGFEGLERNLLPYPTQQGFHFARASARGISRPCLTTQQAPSFQISPASFLREGCLFALLGTLLDT